MGITDPHKIEVFVECVILGRVPADEEERAIIAEIKAIPGAEELLREHHKLETEWLELIAKEKELKDKLARIAAQINECRGAVAELEDKNQWWAGMENAEDLDERIRLLRKHNEKAFRDLIGVKKAIQKRQGETRSAQTACCNIF